MACKDSSSHDSVLTCLFSTSCSHQHVDTTQKESCDKISHFGHDCRKYGMLYNCRDCGSVLPIKPRCIWFSIEWLLLLILKDNCVNKRFKLTYWTVHYRYTLTFHHQLVVRLKSRAGRSPIKRSLPLVLQDVSLCLQDVPLCFTRRPLSIRQQSNRHRPSSPTMLCQLLPSSGIRKWIYYFFRLM